MARNDQSPHPSLSRRAFLQRVGSHFGAIGLAACGIGPSGPTPPQTLAPARPNIVLIMVDALRSDHVVSYGYHRSTTPNLDALITSQGVRFQTALSAAPWTFPSNAAILSGQLPTRVGASWAARPVPAAAALLPEYLSDAGYYSAGFVTAPFLQHYFGLNQGFSHFDDSLAQRPTSNKGRADELNNLAIGWMRDTWLPSQPGQPLFLYLYYFEPHTWYTAPSPYDTLYDPTYSGPFTAEGYANAEQVIKGEMIPTARDIEHLIALYDGEVTFWDAQLGQMLGYLQEQHILDNALVVVTADHGEMFGEHGKWAHGSSLYDEVLRVPLLMRYPGGINSGLVINELVQTMDVMPTLLDFAGVAIPGGLDGISLRPGIQSTASLPQRDFLSVVDRLTQPDNPAYLFAPRQNFHALRRNEWKLIAQLEGGAPDELYMPGPTSLYEQADLGASHPDIVQALRQTIQDRFFPHTAYLPTIQLS